MPAILTDNFNDNAIDSAKWDASGFNFNAGVTVVETGAQLVITPLASTAGTNRNGLQSDATFDLTQGFAVWKLDQRAGADASVVTRCGVFVDANNWIGFEVANTTLTFRKRAASTDDDTTLSYNSTTHKWLMLHHSGTRVSWWTSPDGVTWTPRRNNVAPGFAVTAVKKFFDAGTTGSVATITPATAIFDDVEIGTLDIVAPFEQLAAFGGYVDLIIDPGFPLNIDVDALGGPEPTPFTIPMSRRRTGARVTGTGPILRYRCQMTGNLSRFNAWISGPNAGSTAIIFNVRIDGGSPLWAGGARPSIAPGVSSCEKTGFEVAVTRGQPIEILVDQCPSIGIPTPIDTTLDVVVT